MGCCGSRSYDSVQGGCIMEEFEKSGNKLEIFRGNHSFKLYVSKNNAFQNQIHIPQMWLEAEHCVIHATGDMNLVINGVRIEIPESQKSKKLNDLILDAREPHAIPQKVPCMQESRNIQSFEIVPDWLKVCRVTETVSDMEFYVTLEQFEEDRQVVNAILKESINGPFKQFPQNYDPGTHAVLSHYGLNPARCIISEVMSASTAVVKLLDTGKETICDLKMLTALPSKASFSKYPPQAIRCSLKKNIFNKIERKHLKRCAITEDIVRIHFIMFLGDAWQVAILNNENCGSISMSQNENEINQTLNYADLKRHMQEELKAHDVVKVCHVDEQNSLTWVQRVQDREDITALQQLAEQHSETSDLVAEPQVGNVYLCQSPTNSSFQRGVVVSTLKSLYEVLFMDCGVTEYVPKNQIRTLPSSVKGYQRMGYCCVLKNKLFSSIHKFLSKELEVKSCAASNFAYKVKFTYKGKLINLIEHDDLLNDTSVPDADFPLNTTLSIRVTNVEADGSMWIQLVEDSRLSQVMSTLEESTSGIGAFTVGDFVCSRFSLDDSWYRAQVISVTSNEEIEVLYIDYGNKETVTVQKLKALPDACFSVPAQAIRCKLYEESQDALVLGRVPIPFENVLKGKLIQHKKFGLVLSDAEWCSEAMSSKLISLGAIYSNGDVHCKKIPEIKLLKNQNVDFKIVHVDSDASVWVQLSGNLNVLESIRNCLQDVNPAAPGHPEVGCFYLGRLDEEWVRCEVLTINGTSCDVRFVDFGQTVTLNSETLGILPSDVSEQPIQAIHCSLSCLSKVTVDKALVSRVSNLRDRMLSGELKSGFRNKIYNVVDEEGSVQRLVLEESKKDEWDIPVGWTVPAIESNCQWVSNGEIRPPPRKNKSIWDSPTKSPDLIKNPPEGNFNSSHRGSNQF